MNMLFGLGPFLGKFKKLSVEGELLRGQDDEGWSDCVEKCQNKPVQREILEIL